MKVDPKQLRKDLSLSDKDFEAVYPGLDKKQIEKMTDEELTKVAGGGSLDYSLSGGGLVSGAKKPSGPTFG